MNLLQHATLTGGQSVGITRLEKLTETMMTAPLVMVVVDDDDDVRALTVETLTASGFPVEFQNDARDALEKTGGTSPFHAARHLPDQSGR